MQSIATVSDWPVRETKKCHIIYGQQVPAAWSSRGGATIVKVRGEEISRAERIIPKLCPLYALALKVGGHVSPEPPMVIPPTKLSAVGSRAFPVAAARVWNGLPEAVISSSSLQSFLRQLKTHLFQLSYPHPIL